MEKILTSIHTIGKNIRHVCWRRRLCIILTSNHGYTVLHPSAAGALDTVLPVADVLVPVDARVDVLVSVVARADVLVSEVARVDVLVPGVTGMADRITPWPPPLLVLRMSAPFSRGVRGTTRLTHLPVPVP